MKTLYCLVKFHWINNGVSQFLQIAKKTRASDNSRNLNIVIWDFRHQVNVISCHFPFVWMGVQTSDSKVEDDHIGRVGGPK